MVGSVGIELANALIYSVLSLFTPEFCGDRTLMLLIISMLLFQCESQRVDAVTSERLRYNRNIYSMLMYK